MVEVSFDAKVKWTKDVAGDRVMVAVEALGVAYKDLHGKDFQLAVYYNAFFPKSFRGVAELRHGEVVRISGRVTTVEQIEDRKGKNITTLRVAIHGYSINKAWRQGDRTNVAAELGAA